MTVSTAKDSFQQYNQCVRFVPSDAIMFNRTRDQVSVFETSLSAAQDNLRVSRDTALAWGFDTYLLLNKNKPELSGAGDQLGKELCKRVRAAERYNELRSYTVMDDVASLLSACSLMHELAVAVPEELKRKSEAARKAAEDAEVAKVAAEVASQSSASANEKLEAQEAAIEAADRAEAAKHALASSIRTHGAALSKAANDAVSNAAANTSALHIASHTFGNGTAQVCGGLPVAEKMRLADLVKNSGPSFVNLVRLLGRLCAEATQKQVTKTTHEAGAIVDVTLGSDISNVLDDELVQLLVPDLEMATLAKLADDAAMQYEVENREPQNKGDVVVLLDESGSMAGQREAEAKAVALAIAHVCGKQGRKIVVHFFQSTVTCTVSIDPIDYKTQSAQGNVGIGKLCEIALRGTAGGTSFDEPLKQAIATLRGDKMQKADVLFITDGECVVTPTTLADVEAASAQFGAQFYGMLIGRHGQPNQESLKFCRKVWACQSLLDGAASELFELI